MKLLTNVRIISPCIDTPNACIEIDSERICTVRTEMPDSLDLYQEVIDGKGSIMMPGFIDIHTHGGGGRSFMEGSKEAVEAIAKQKSTEGVTSFLPTTASERPEVIRGAFQAIKEYQQEESSSKVIGVHMEGPFFNSECPGAQNPEYIYPLEVDFIDELDAVAPIKIISLSTEEPNALSFVRTMTDRGIVCSHAHSKATSAEVLEASKSGVSHMTHFCNLMTPIHHRDIGAVGQGLMNDNLKLELICDTIHICPEMLQLIFKLKNTRKLMLVTDSVEVSGLPDGTYSMDGVTVILKEGIVRIEAGNLAGSTLSYNKGLKNVHDATGIPLSELVRTTSLNQAQSLQLDSLGKIEEGFFADFVLLDKELNVLETWSRGNRIY